MIIRLIILTFIYIFFVLQQRIFCSYKGSNINELISIIGNAELYDDLIKLEKLILQSLEFDELKLPLLKKDTEMYLNMYNFRTEKIIKNTKEYYYIIPTSRCSTEDLVKFEYIVKEQLIGYYDPRNSDLVKKKNLIVRSLKIIKFMLLPMNFYKKTKKLKETLMVLNNSIIYNSEKLNKTSIYRRRNGAWLIRMNKLRQKNISKKLLVHMPIYTDSNIIQSNDLYFTTCPDINFMIEIDKTSDFYNLGIFNFIGSHFIALGHFIVLKLALKYFSKYFELGSAKFYSWKNILQFNISDRFKVLDLLCDASGSYVGNTKRRKQYLKDNRISSSEECDILEFLIHYLNKYQMELYTSAYHINMNIQVLLENSHLKDNFFKFMCNSKKSCNIYDSYKFKKEYDIKPFIEQDNEFSKNIQSESSGINAFNIYINFLYFIKHYGYFNKNNILYVHLLNLIGILNGESKAYVSSIYLPGYYNIIQLSFDEKFKLTELYQNLLECVETCHIEDGKHRKIRSDIYSFFNYKKCDLNICNICEGSLFYINSQNKDNISMLQKFYFFVTEVLKINNISSLIENVNIFDDYNNFLMHDVNWFTFLLLFRITSYKGVARTGIANAMYLNLKSEDKFRRSVLTSYWFPSTIKKYYTFYIRKKKSVNLLEKLESLIKSTTIEKMKKCIKFIVHVNSILQLDFFYYLNEPPLKKQLSYSLTMLIEQKFKDWFIHYLTGYFFINYEDGSTRENMDKKMESGEFIVPRYSKWISHMKKIVQESYEAYFNQRHVKNLFKYHNTYNINNKMMLMRDSFELYSKNYESLFFSSEIIDLKRSSFFSKKEKRMEKILYYMHSFWGNSLNYSKFGIIYGYTVNKIYLREIVDELLSLYKLNKHIFSDISFLQTVYLLFRKIQSSFYSHRRNDNISMNNIFFFNVAKDYSKLSKKGREEEINSSMASRFFSKTLFAVFQMLFTIRLSNDMDKLDRIYGSSEMIGLSIHEEPFLKFAYAYYGSMMDNLTNSFLPLYIKKPITQLKYGKTFILANMYKLCSDIFSLLNFNNLSLLCEYQAVASSNYYSYKKLSQFIDRKYTGIVISAFILKILDVQKEALGQGTPYINKFKWPGIMYILGLSGIYFSGSILFRNILFFPRTLPGELREQIKHSLPEEPKEKPSVFSIDINVNIAMLHSLSVSMFLHNLMRWFAFYENVIFLIRNSIRLFDRFYTILENYVSVFIKSNLNKITSDVLLNVLERTYRAVLNEGYYKEAIKARISAKKIGHRRNKDFSENDIHLLRTEDIELLSGNCNFMYVDNSSFFENLEENENFLNEERDVCFEDYSEP